jgi:CMP/dCMP kinase
MVNFPFIAPRLDPVVIAIDGPAASGKGTLARAVAAEYDFHYLDTGTLYRAVAWTMLESGLNPHDEPEAEKTAQTLDLANIEDANLRTGSVSEAASIVAAMSGVRSAILDFQRRFARQLPGAVVDGRDIGTVVCPQADVKLYVTANPKIRANRRFLELKAKGESVSEAGVLADVAARDQRDASRAHSPLKPAEDAHLIDTSDLSIEAAFRAALGIIEDVLSSRADAH